MRYLTCIFSALLCASLAAPAAPAAETPAPPRSPLEAVAALQQPVTYTETKIPLGELVARVAADTRAKLTASLYQLLDRLSGTDHHWERVTLEEGAGTLVWLRRRDWYFARPREIPLRLVRHWQALCDQRGALPLPEQTASAAKLSADQWSSLRFVGYQAGLPDGFLGSRAALQLLAALTPAQQQALWKGKTVSMAEMTPAQRALYLEPFERSQWYMLRHRLTPYPPPVASDADLSMACQRLILIRECRGPFPSYGTEPAPPADGSPDPVSAAVRPPRTSLGPDAHAPSASRSEAPAATRYPITRIDLRFDYAPELHPSESLTIPSPS